MAGVEIGRKITAKLVFGPPSQWFERLMKDKEIKMMNVFGYANGTKVGVSEYNEYVKLLGNFRAINCDTGEITTAPIVILPTNVGDSIKSALDAPERTGPVQFAFEIGVRLDMAAATKYTYYLKDLQPPSASDPLEKLGAQLGLTKLPAVEKQGSINYEGEKVIADEKTTAVATTNNNKRR